MLWFFRAFLYKRNDWKLRKQAHLELLGNTLLHYSEDGSTNMLRNIENYRARHDVTSQNNWCMSSTNHEAPQCVTFSTFLAPCYANLCSPVFYSLDHTKTWLRVVEEIGTCCTDIYLYILMNELRLVSVSEKKEKTKQLSLIKISLNVHARQPDAAANDGTSSCSVRCCWPLLTKSRGARREWQCSHDHF